MIEYIMAGIVIILIVLLSIHGMNVTINVNVEHKFPEGNVIPVEDPYDKDGNVKDYGQKAIDFNEALKDIHNFMMDADDVEE